MPNFHVHWVVALRAISSAPDGVQRGFRLYGNEGRALRKKLVDLLQRIRAPSGVDEARGEIWTLRETWTNYLLNDAPADERDDMTQFSAYALGACGPDFWTLASDSGGVIPDFASEHFDLGHYNRTHAQFDVSVGAAGGRYDLDALAEQAYFAGMATHFAADLAIHQLVNVSAGAYNLLKKHWHNEQPHGNPLWRNVWNELVAKSAMKAFLPALAPMPDFRPFLEDNLGNQIGIWSTHNKVEHYWDTYVRHRYLGDVAAVFPDHDALGWDGCEQVGLPTAEGLWRSCAAGYDAPTARAVGQLLQEPWVKWAIEKPLMLPWLFSERVLSAEVQPFIFDRVVREDGAYPEALVPKAVVKEKTSPQMAPTKKLAKKKTGRSERKKLAYFSSAANDLDSKPTSWNYLTFYVCPDYAKLSKQEDRPVDPAWLPGANVFYDLPALGHFVLAGASIAGKFLRALDSAYHANASTEGAIGDLAGFWNLDTGLGIRIESVATDTAKDVVTRIELRHVFDLLPEPCLYFRQVPWMGRIRDQKAQLGFPAQRAFKFRESQQRYASVAEISEPDQDAYLEAIRLTEEARAAQDRPPRVDPDAFWNVQRGSQLLAIETPTGSVCDGAETRLSVLDLAHRLTLWFRAGVADLGGGAAAGVACEKLSLFAVSDKLKAVSPMSQAAMDWTHDQLEDHDGVILDFSEKPDFVRHGVQYFSTRVLLGFETDPELKRIVELGTWNNAVARTEAGRDISIATGRRFVLHPTPPSVALPFTHKRGGVQFHPLDHFEYYEDASPTEQLLFTIYPLVQTNEGVFDMFSKDQVSSDKEQQLLKIDSVGFVKIVLYYALTPRGALQVDRCFVDGLPVPIARVNG